MSEHDQDEVSCRAAPRMLRRSPAGEDGRRAALVAELPVEGVSALDPLELRSSFEHGMASLHGETDISNHERFVAVVDAALRSGSGLAAGGDVHLDLEGLGFIDVDGARALVEASARLGRGRRLVLHHPPPALVHMLRIAWRDAPGLELGEVRGRRGKRTRAFFPLPSPQAVAGPQAVAAPLAVAASLALAASLAVAASLAAGGLVSPGDPAAPAAEWSPPQELG